MQGWAIYFTHSFVSEVQARNFYWDNYTADYLDYTPHVKSKEKGIDSDRPNYVYTVLCQKVSDVKTPEPHYNIYSAKPLKGPIFLNPNVP